MCLFNLLFNLKIVVVTLLMNNLNNNFYYISPRAANKLDIDQLAQPVPKKERFSKKIPLCVWWNFEGVIHFELIPNGVAVDADLCCAQLDQMFFKLQQETGTSATRQRKTAHCEENGFKNRRYRIC